MSPAASGGFFFAATQLFFIAGKKGRREGRCFLLPGRREDGKECFYAYETQRLACSSQLVALFTDMPLLRSFDDI